MVKDTDFKLTLKLRIDWSELDTFQHVNNINFMKYMQSARVQFWEATGLSNLYESTKKGPILVSSKCDFMKPLFFPGNVLIKTKTEFIKNSSFGLHHKLYNDNGDLCAEGHDVAVCFDFKTDTPFLITDDLRDAMQKYL